jgi:altronate dehydratase
MLIAFLMGLLAAVAAIAVIAILVMGVKWLKGYVVEKLKNREKHKVAFADTREIVNDYISQKVDEAEEISMDDLEKMCAKTPYVAAIVDDETGEITDFEGIKANATDASFKARMKQQKGMVIIGV